MAPLFYSLRFSVSLPAYINLQRSCRKASCSSSRESHIIFKAVMMNIQTICLPSGSYCSLFVITQMGISSVAIELQFGVVLCSFELRRLVALNPNEQFSIRRLVFFFSEGNFSKSSKQKLCTHHLQSDLCMTPNFLLQVWARKLFPFILFYSGFKILLLRS